MFQNGYVLYELNFCVQRFVCCHFGADKPVKSGSGLVRLRWKGTQMQPNGKDREVFPFFGFRVTLWLLNRCFRVPELNFRNATCCLGGSNQI